VAVIFKPAEELIDIGSLVQWAHRTRVPPTWSRPAHAGGRIGPAAAVEITWHDWHSALRDEYYRIEIENVDQTGEWCFHGLLAELSAYRPRDPWRGLDVPDYIGPHGMRFFHCSQEITGKLVRRNAKQSFITTVKYLIAHGDFVARVARLAPMPLMQVQIEALGGREADLLTIVVEFGPGQILELYVSAAPTRFRRVPFAGVRVWTSPSGIDYYAAAPPAWLRP
jgi:hypothetical protein